MRIIDLFRNVPTDLIAQHFSSGSRRRLRESRAILVLLPPLLVSMSVVLQADTAPVPGGTAYGPGAVAVSGFSGIKLQGQGVAPGVDPINKTVIDPDSITLRIYGLNALGGPLAGQLVNPDLTLEFKAKDVGHVFGLAFDNEPASSTTTPGLYAAATSAFGLNILGPDKDGDGQPDRLKKGAPGAKFAGGQFGAGPDAGPGSIWKIDRATGAVSLFANLEANGLKNSGAGIGGLAFDPASRTLYASDLDTGLIHRLSIAEKGKDLGQFDHGVTGRPVRSKPAVKDDGERLDIESPNFDPAKPLTWETTQLERRVDALTVHNGRLYYSVAEGPEVWSVGLEDDGSFKSDVRFEAGIESQKPYPVTGIAFDGTGNMIVAQRAFTQNPADYAKFVEDSPAQVLRLKPETPDDADTPGLWQQSEPEEYAAGEDKAHRSGTGGLAIFNTFRPDGTIDRASCTGTAVFSTDAIGPERAGHGLQFSDVSAVLPANVPPKQSAFININPKQDDAEVRGYAGGVAALQACGGDAFPPVAGDRGGGSGGGGTTTFPAVTDGTTAPTVDPTFPTVEPGPDEAKAKTLTVTKTALVAKCSPKGGCAFNVQVSNPNPAPFPGPIVIEDNILAERAALTGEPNVPWACTKTAPFQCTHPGPLPPNGTLDMRVVFAPNTPPDVKSVTNCASLQGSPPPVQNAPPPKPPGPGPAPAPGGNAGGVPAPGPVADPAQPPQQCATIALDPNVPVQGGDVVVAKKGPAKCPAKGPCAFEITLTNTTDQALKGSRSFIDRIDIPGAKVGALPAGLTCEKDGADNFCTLDGTFALGPKESKTFMLTLELEVPAGKTEVKNCVIPQFGGGGKTVPAPPGGPAAPGGAAPAPAPGQPAPAAPAPPADKKVEFAPPFGTNGLVHFTALRAPSSAYPQSFVHRTGAEGGNIAGDQCLQWEMVNRGFVLQQANGVEVRFFDMQIAGDNVTGRASHFTSNGPVEGSVSFARSPDPKFPNRFEFRVNWSNGAIGTYELRLDDAGVLSGENIDDTRARSAVTGDKKWWKCVANSRCNDYSKKAKDAADEFASFKCGTSLGRWTPNARAHTDFCMGQPANSPLLQSETDARTAELAACLATDAQCTQLGKDMALVNNELKALKCDRAVTSNTQTTGPDTFKKLCRAQLPQKAAVTKSKMESDLAACKVEKTNLNATLCGDFAREKAITFGEISKLDCAAKAGIPAVLDENAIKQECMTKTPLASQDELQKLKLPMRDTVSKCRAEVAAKGGGAGGNAGAGGDGANPAGDAGAQAAGPAPEQCAVVPIEGDGDKGKPDDEVVVAGKKDGGPADQGNGLTIQKSAAADCTAGQPCAFNIKVTSKTPGTPGKIVVVDTPDNPAGLGLAQDVALATLPPAPWQCAKGMPISCEHPGPVPAEGLTLPLSLKIGAQTAAKSVRNCAAIDTKPAPAPAVPQPKVTENAGTKFELGAPPSCASGAVCAWQFKVTNSSALPVTASINWSTDLTSVANDAATRATKVKFVSVESNPPANCNERVNDPINHVQCVLGEVTLAPNASYTATMNLQADTIAGAGNIQNTVSASFNTVAGQTIGKASSAATTQAAKAPDDAGLAPKPSCAEVPLQAPVAPPPPPPPPAEAAKAGTLSLVKTAKPPCRDNRACDFQIVVTNDGDAEFKGQVEFDDNVTGDGAIFGAAALQPPPPAPWACTKGLQGFNCKADLTIPAKASAPALPLTTDLGAGIGAVKEVKNCVRLKDAAKESCATVPLQAPVQPPPPPPPPAAGANTLVLANNPAAEQCSDLGGGCAFTISITNPGPEEFNAPLEFSDTPSTADGKPFLGAGIDGGGQAIQQPGVIAPVSCGKTGEGFTCTTGVAAAKIPAGKTVVVPISFKPGSAGDTTAIKTCAALKGGAPQCRTIPFIKGALLRAEKIGISDTCVPSCSFIISLKNVGTADAAGPFALQDKFTPASGAISVEEIGGGFNCGQANNGTTVCISSTDVLRPGDSIIGSMMVKGAAQAPEYTNCLDYDPAANGKPSPFDTTFAGRCVTIKDTAPKRPNLVIAKRAPNVEGGPDGHCDLKSACRFTITVTNNGSAPFTGPLRISDTVSPEIPQGIGIGPGSPQSLPWKCDSVLNGGAIAQTSITCELPPLPNGLAPGTTATLEVAVTPGTTWKGSDRLTNCAEIVSDGDIGLNAVKKSCASVKLDPFSVKAAKTGDTQCLPGSNCTFKITLFNPGPINHNAPVTIEDKLTGLSSAQIVSINPPLPCAPQPMQIPFSCTSPGPVRLDVDAAAGTEFGPREFTMVVRLPNDATAAQFSNCASVAGQSGRVGTSQSCVTVSTKPVVTDLPAPRLKPIAKSAVSAACGESQPCDFKITITNTLGRTMAGPIVVDDLVTIAGEPSTQMKLVSGPPAPWTCVASAAPGMQCSHPGPLAINASIDLTLGLQPMPGSLGTAAEVKNCATFEGMRPEVATACASIPVKKPVATTTPPTTGTCSGGMVLNDGLCTCPGPTKWNGRQCVGSGGAYTSKPGDENPANPPPVPVPGQPTPATCSVGMVLTGGLCACPAPTTWNGRKCVNPGPGTPAPSDDPEPAADPAPRPTKPVDCGPNARFRNGQCQCRTGLEPTRRGGCRPIRVKEPEPQQPKETQSCPDNRPVGKFPNCCPVNSQFRNGGCQCLPGFELGRRGVCRPARQTDPAPQPKPETPVKCPPDTIFINGQCRRLAIPTPQPKPQPQKRDCGPGYVTRDTPNKYGNYCDPIAPAEKCPTWAPEGTPPNCHCPEGTVRRGNFCGPAACPPNMTGTPPNCHRICPAGTVNQNESCVPVSKPDPVGPSPKPVPAKCGKGFSGTPPNCECNNGEIVNGECFKGPS